MRLDEGGRYVPADVTVDAEVLDHAGGFRLIRLGTNLPYKGVYFRYEKQDVGFYFFADRTHSGGTVTGTYEVVKGFNPGQEFGRGAWPLTCAQMRAFAADIDAGLRAWPPTLLEAERPIGVVHCHFFTYASGPCYRFAFGKPLRLCDVSPSARWRKRKILHRVMRGDTEEPGEFSAMVRDDGVQLMGALAVVSAVV
jgi:hypothetical protein